MKILIIPDIHGNKDWKNNFLNNIENVDKCVFLGDYLDSFNTDERGQNGADNLKDILSITEKYKDKTILCIGNHDIKYCLFNGAYNHHISGHQTNMDRIHSEIFEKNKNRFQIAVKLDKWVFSHAGFTKDWYNHSKAWLTTMMPNVKTPNGPINLANWMWKNDECRLLDFSDYDWSGYGESVLQGPTWCRIESVFKAAYYKYQVVGHTEVKCDKPLLVTNEKRSKRLLCCDHPSHNNIFILDTNWSSDELENHCETRFLG